MGSRKSFLEIINETNQDIIITVDETNNYDWDGDSRPDHNFNGASISKHSSKKEREELNSNAGNAPFRMHIKFGNGDNISFENDQYDAFSKFQRIYNLEGLNSQEYAVYQANSGDGVNTFKIFPFSLKKWMKSIPNDTSLLNMSIPGTHETCATQIVDPTRIFEYAQCQKMSISDQLENGVRYLDIRAEARKKDTGDYLTIKHNDVQEPVDFNDVLREIIRFLNDNPSETVLMQLKQESSNWDPIDYASLVENYINNDEYKNYFYLDEKNLNLGDVRGKIVLVNRFYNSSTFGINVSKWDDDTYFSKNNGELKYNIQDVYTVCKSDVEYSRDRKMDFINLFFKEYAFIKDQLNLCFCSAVCPAIATPESFAAGSNGINERTIKQHLSVKNGWNGVILFDFIDSYPDSIGYTINNNFKK